MKQCIHKYSGMWENIRSQLHMYGEPLALLVARLYVANVFFVSGWLKFGYVLNDQVDTLYFLFEEYNVPFLSVEMAAWSGMIGELVLSVLLAIGLFSRVAGLGLIVMAGIIYTVDQNNLSAYWAIICAIIVTRGAGPVSLDAWLWKRVSQSTL